MNQEIENDILKILSDTQIFIQKGGIRYSGNDEYHNWYKIGYNENNIFGELDFSKKPTWRVSFYENGRFYYDSGFLLSNIQKLISIILNKCIPGIKKKKIDDKKAEIEKEFE